MGFFRDKNEFRKVFEKLFSRLDLLPIVAPFHRKWVMALKADGQLHLLA